MKHLAKSIRTFIGAKDFEQSRNFYKELGFEEFIISDDMSYFKISQALGFYLQDYYVRDWVNNSMIFLEVDNLDQHWVDLQSLDLHHKYKCVKLSAIKEDDWGREFFLHDPSGVLWHYGAFNAPS